MPFPMWKMANVPSGSATGALLCAHVGTATSLKAYGPVIVVLTAWSMRELCGQYAREQSLVILEAYRWYSPAAGSYRAPPPHVVMLGDMP